MVIRANTSVCVLWRKSCDRPSWINMLLPVSVCCTWLHHILWTRLCREPPKFVKSELGKVQTQFSWLNPQVMSNGSRVLKSEILIVLNRAFPKQFKLVVPIMQKYTVKLLSRIWTNVDLLRRCPATCTLVSWALSHCWLGIFKAF